MLVNTGARLGKMSTDFAKQIKDMKDVEQQALKKLYQQQKEVQNYIKNSRWKQMREIALKNYLRT